MRSNGQGDNVSRTLKADLLLLFTAIIWGFSFVAQRKGMDFVGPYFYNGIRFLLGAATLYVIVSIRGKRKGWGKPLPGIVLGVILFAAVSLQQVGLVYTTAGKAGFITGLYVVFVPVLGIFLRQRIGVFAWLGVLLAVVGLYFLSVNESFSISYGEILVLLCAVVWAVQIQFIDRQAKLGNQTALAFYSFVTCAILSLIAALIVGEVRLEGMSDAWLTIAYGGVLSVGVAFSLQIVAQRDAPPSHAAVLFSLESVFALIGGMLILHEKMSFRSYLGCGLILLGILMLQLPKFLSKRSRV